ncbi:MAG: hypothetical protein V1834_01770 [Candidatus Micrarchaeota archaeon]
MGLRHVFGDKPVPKVLDFFLVHRDWDYPLSTISEATGVSYRTIQNTVPQLVKNGFLVETRVVGKAKLYRLNANSPSVKKLGELSIEADLEFATPTKHRTKAVVVV